MEIKNLDQGLAHQILRQIAEELGSNWRVSERTLEIKAGPYSYFRIKSTSEGLQWEYDDWGSTMKFNLFRRTFTQRYQTEKIRRSLKKLGYRIKVVKKKGKIYIGGSR